MSYNEGSHERTRDHMSYLTDETVFPQCWVSRLEEAPAEWRAAL